MGKCKNCGHRISGPHLEDPEIESETALGYCNACADHLAEQAEYRAYLRNGGEPARTSPSTNESHDPSQWSWHA